MTGSHKESKDFVNAIEEYTYTAGRVMTQ